MRIAGNFTSYVEASEGNSQEVLALPFIIFLLCSLIYSSEIVEKSLFLIKYHITNLPLIPQAGINSRKMILLNSFHSYLPSIANISINVLGT